MKKIRVYELAKNKNLSNHEVIEMLRKKGLKKVSAITYVDPDILGGGSDSKKVESTGAKVSHLFGKPSASNLATVKAVALKPVSVEKKAVAKKNVEVKKPETKIAASAEQKKSVIKQTMPPKKEGVSVASIFAIVISIIALVTAGYLYSGFDSNMARMEKLSTDLQASMNRLDSTVTDNRAQLLGLQNDMTSANRQIDNVRDMTFSSQLKSQSAVLSVIATQLNEPLRTKTKSLADNLAAF